MLRYVFLPALRWACGEREGITFSKDFIRWNLNFVFVLWHLICSNIWNLTEWRIIHQFRGFRSTLKSPRDTRGYDTDTHRNTSIGSRSFGKGFGGRGGGRSEDSDDCSTRTAMTIARRQWWLQHDNSDDYNTTTVMTKAHSITHQHTTCRQAAHSSTQHADRYLTAAHSSTVYITHVYLHI